MDVSTIASSCPRNHVVVAVVLATICGALLRAATVRAAPPVTDSLDEMIEHAELELATRQYADHGALVYRAYSEDGKAPQMRTELHYTGGGRGGYRPGCITEGQAALWFIPAGQEIELRIRTRGYHEFRRSLVAAKQHIAVWDDIILEAVTPETGCVVHGVLWLEDDVAPEGIKVCSMGQEAVADADGRFTLSELPSGTVCVCACVPGYRGAYARMELSGGEVARCELRAFRARAALVRWAYQPDESSDLVYDVTSGAAILAPGSLNRVSFSAGFEQVSSRSDLLVCQDQDELTIRNFDVRQDGPGIIELPDVAFEDVRQAPKAPYKTQARVMTEGAVYVLRCYDGRHFAKIEVLRILDGEHEIEQAAAELAQWGP